MAIGRALLHRAGMGRIIIGIIIGIIIVLFLLVQCLGLVV